MDVRKYGPFFKVVIMLAGRLGVDIGMFAGFRCA